MRRRSNESSSLPSLNLLAPTTMRSPELKARSNSYAESEMRPWNQLSSIPSIQPSSMEPWPISEISANITSAISSILLVRSSTNQEPPSGSATCVTFVSCAMTCCVRSAIRAAFSVGKAIASSIELVCNDCAPPITAASASTAVRTMLTSGC